MLGCRDCIQNSRPNGLADRLRVRLGVQLTDVAACAMLKPAVVAVDPEPVNWPVVG